LSRQPRPLSMRSRIHWSFYGILLIIVGILSGIYTLSPILVEDDPLWLFTSILAIVSPGLGLSLIFFKGILGIREVEKFLDQLG